MKKTPRDYRRLTAMARHCGMIPYDRCDKIAEGTYTLKGFHVPIDLSTCAEDEKSILRTAVGQLSEQAEKSYHNTIVSDALKFCKDDLRRVWEAAKEGSIQDRPVVIDQYGSVNIEQHFVDKYRDFENWFKKKF